MANSLISMIKGDSTLINNTEVLDGQVLFNTDEKTILLDDDNTRTKYCGADKSNKNLAPIENGNTATRGYAAGSYVVWKEQLYKVLTQINSGTAFVVGTNIALDTVGAELTQLKSDLNNLNAKQYSVYGSIANGTGTTFSGIGSATVLLLKGGVAIIYYEYTITALNKTGVYTYGLNRDILHTLNSNIPNIIPINGGICHILAKYDNFPNANNTILRPIWGDAFGYAQINVANGQFWMPGRVYDASGSVGGWPENIGFNVNDSIYGIAFGTY